MDEVTIRLYRPGDFPRMCHIHDAARKQELAHAGLSDAFVPLEVAAESEGLFDYAVYIAEADGQPVGFVAYSPEELAWLYVDPDHMRQGIGRRLTDHVLKGTGHRPLSIEVLKGNNPALRLYESMGFRMVEECSGAMPGNEAFRVTVHVLQIDN